MSFESIVVPEDEGISSTHYCLSSPSLIATTSWAGSLNFYNVETKEQVFNLNAGSPLLCSTWIEGTCVAGSSDGVLFFSDNKTIKAHENGISSISLIPDTNLLLSSSWDSTIKIWDLRQEEPAWTFLAGERVFFSGASTLFRGVAYTHTNHILIFDTRGSDSFVPERRVSSLLKQIRSFSISKPDFGWAVGSIDGRIAIEYFGDIRHQAQRFAFECHREQEEIPENSEENINQENPESNLRTIVYPVNALAFSSSGILASGSSAGTVNFWNLEEKRKISELSSGDTAISAMDFSPDGNSIAIAMSYMWDKGPIEHGLDGFGIYTLE